jgi:hypothetical protein
MLCTIRAGLDMEYVVAVLTKYSEPLNIRDRKQIMDMTQRHIVDSDRPLEMPGHAGRLKYKYMLVVWMTRSKHDH